MTTPKSTDVAEIEAVLTDMLQEKSALANAIDPVYGELLQYIEKLLRRGGKRGRPQLVIRAYEAYGGTNRQAIIKAAASQELFHAFILMHDDIIDRDLVRWGGPNISGEYYRLLSKGRPGQEARHLADARALLAGDICHNLSTELLLASGFPPKALLKASNLVHATMFTLVGGELLDVAVSDQSIPKETITQERLITVAQTKTAAYSFSMPLQLGALLAGASARDLQKLEQFGRPTGVAFQLRDDILGIFGEEEQLGKSTLSDIREGKRTVLMSYGLELATPLEHRKLVSILGNPAATRANLKTVRQLLTSSGALQRTEQLMDLYEQKAVRSITAKSFPPRLAEHLQAIVLYSKKRQK